jgi:16S rRNA (guanine527-N7)-methyltransferase
LTVDLKIRLISIPFFPHLHDLVRANLGNTGIVSIPRQLTKATPLFRYNQAPMEPDRIRELLGPFLARELSAPQIKLVSSYLELLAKWNSKINLTAVRSPEEIVTRHFGEAFFAAQRLLPDPSVEATAIDLGSGAGFPGLPMKIWAPRLSLTLIESKQKKAVFLRDAARALDLVGMTVLAQRAEDVRLQADLVTLRAVERFERVLRVAERLVATRGRLGLLIGSTQVQTAQSTLSGFEFGPSIAIPQSRSRVLLVGARREF